MTNLLVLGQHYLVHSFDDEFVTKCRSSQEGYSLKLEWYRKGTKIMKAFDTSQDLEAPNQSN